MIDIEAADAKDLSMVHEWLRGQLAADVARITVSATTVSVALSNGSSFERPRASARLSSDLDSVVSAARRQRGLSDRYQRQPSDGGWDDAGPEIELEERQEAGLGQGVADLRLRLAALRAGEEPSPLS